MTHRRVAIVFNPNAGTLLQLPDGHDFERFLREETEQNKTLSINTLEFNPNKLIKIKATITQGNFDEVWAVGGDGTIISVANMLQGTDIPLGVIPGGTMNLLARDIGMSLDLSQAIKQLLDSVPGTIDIAKINDNPFFCIVNIGLTTRLTEKREELRQLPGWIRWPRVALESIKHIFVYRPIKIKLIIGNRTLKFKTKTLSVTNNPLKDSIGLIPERRGLNNGVLGIYVTKSHSVWTLPKLALKYLTGHWKQDSDIVDFETTEAEIQINTRREMRIMIDGEMHLIEPPFRFRIMPNALSILKPSQRSR